MKTEEGTQPEGKTKAEDKIEKAEAEVEQGSVSIATKQVPTMQQIAPNQKRKRKEIKTDPTPFIPGQEIYHRRGEVQGKVEKHT